MARLLRGYGESRLRAGITGPAVVFAPTRVRLAEQNRPVAADTRRLAHYRIRAGVVGPAVVFAAPRVTLGVRSAAAYAKTVTHSKLRSDTGGPARIFQPQRVTLAGNTYTNVRRLPHGFSRPPVIAAPAVVVSVFPPTNVRLAPAPKQGRQPHYVLRAGVVAPAVVFAPPRVELAPTFQPKQDRGARYRLRPGVPGASVVFPATKVTLGKPHPAKTFYRLSSPRLTLYKNVVPATIVGVSAFSVSETAIRAVTPLTISGITTFSAALVGSATQDQGRDWLTWIGVLDA